MNAVSATTAPRSHCVYFLTDGCRVKIGTTTNLSRRIATLSGACGVRLKLLRVVEHAGPRVERWLHKKFKELRRHGEWFDWHPDMMTVQPPEEASSIPCVVLRRDVRLTLMERMKKADDAADLMGLTQRERLIILTQEFSEEEAAAVCDAIWAHVVARAGVPV